MPAVIGIVGAVLGVVGSVLFKADTAALTFRRFLAPLAAAPLTIVPNIQMIKSTPDAASFTELALLFSLAYQTGFFWERLLHNSDASAEGKH